MKKVLTLKTEVRNSIWASGEPENLISAHDDAFQEAFTEIAKYVDGERDDNVDLIRFVKTYYKAGMTVVTAPRGIVTRIFTVANEDYSDPVFYRQVQWPGPEAWSRNLYLFPLPPLTSLPALPLGFQFADAENDSLYGRARTGIWAFYQGNIYIAPWIQSNELVVVEWKGIKEKWEDNDLINPEILYKKAVKLYVQFAHERDYGDAQRAVQFHNTISRQGWYDEALGDLIHEDAERTKTRALPDAGGERNRLCSELADDAPPTTSDGVIITDVGNISLPGDDLNDVKRLTKGFGAKAVTASGLIAGTVTDYDLTAGLSFHNFMSPYGGVNGKGAESKAFWPAPSAADWAKDSLATFASFFGTPRNGRYYDVVIGDVHLFVIDSSGLEPDGVTSGSTQAIWLQGALALSTAPWKVVKMDLCPWGSVHQTAGLQWPFQAWGAHVVLCSQAKNYERSDISGLVVINNGLGGQTPIEPPVAPLATTKATYSAKYGAGKITASLTSFLYEFFNVEGQLIDSVTLSK